MTDPRDDGTRDDGSRDDGTRPLADEAVRLLEMLSGLVGDHSTGSHPSGEAGARAGDGVGSAHECRVCPVCRLIAAMRQVRPEVVSHLVAAGEELLAAAREFAAPAPDPDPGPARHRGPASGPVEDADAAAPRPPSRVPEPIDLD